MPVFAQSPADVIQVFSAALHDGRVEDALALYEPDAVFVPGPGTPVITGREHIRHALQNLAALRPQLAANIRNVIVAGDVATVVNNWRMSGSAPDGTPVSMSGTSADVMRHRPDGTWGILIDDPWAMPAT
ncbi:MAG TPA: SgcJ/EcaC family oxidoreductase [Ktedonobacterales bacterium]|nr:SgcJ/EcaC family oxidoreductase [Ktedonobacterales bacterium]